MAAGRAVATMGSMSTDVSTADRAGAARLPAAVHAAPQPHRPQDRRRLRRPRPVRRHRPADRSAILFVVLAVFGGSGLLLYALGWLLVPEDGETESEGERLFHGRSKSSLSTVLAIVVVLVVGLAATGTLLDSGPGLGGLGVLVVVVGPRRPAAAQRVAARRSPAPAAAEQPAAPARRAGCVRPDAGHRLLRAGRATRPGAAVVVRTDRAAAAAARRPRLPGLRRRRPRRRRRSAQGAVDPGPGHALRRADRRGAARSAGTRPPTRTCRPGSSSPRRWPSSVAGCWSARSSAGPAGWSCSASCSSLLASVASISGVQVRGGVGDRTWDPQTVGQLRDRRTGSGSARPTSTCRPST